MARRLIEKVKRKSFKKRRKEKKYINEIGPRAQLLL